MLSARYNAANLTKPADITRVWPYTEKTMSDLGLELWTLDQLCDHAFDIFEELAEENLSASDFQLYLQHADLSAYVDLVTPTADWEDWFAVSLEPELHVEAQIGLSQVNGVEELLLARILLSKEKYENLCHARWRGQAEFS